MINFYRESYDFFQLPETDQKTVSEYLSKHYPDLPNSYRVNLTNQDLIVLIKSLSEEGGLYFLNLLIEEVREIGFSNGQDSMNLY